MPETSELDVDLIINHEPWRTLEPLETVITPAATAAYEAACEREDIKGPHEVAINLSNDSEIQTLNHQFRGKDTPTNVLSFPFEDDFPQQTPGPQPLGDIILALETVSREAVEQNKPLDHHIAHLVVHGVLHLFGYDHMNENEANEMEQLESKILATLNIPCPYLDA